MTRARDLATSAINAFSDADHTHLNNIEANADVTDATNVVAALTAGTNVAIASDGTVSSADTTKLPLTGGTVTGTLTATKLVSADGVLELDDNGSHNGIINSPASLRINIDSDNGATGESFQVGKNQTSIDANNILFQVTESGDVGIGAASPATNLHVKGAAGAYTTSTIESGSATHGAILEFGDPTDRDYGSITQFASSSGEGGRLRFVAGTTETMNLRGGKVGIGTTDPDYKLDVSSTVQIRAGEGLRLQNAAGNNAATIQCAGAGTNSDLGFSTAGTTRMLIDTSGNVGIGASGSNIDAKLHVVGAALVGTAAANTTIDDSLSTGLDVVVGSGTKAFQVWDDGDTSVPRVSVLRNGATTFSQTNTEVNTESDIGAYVNFKNLSTAINTGIGLAFGSNNNSGAIIVAQRVGANNEHVMKLQTRNSSGAAATRVTVESGGNLTIEDGNLVVAANHGIVFGVDGTGAGADTSELLDDYEEGTWSPAWTSTSASFSYTAAVGNYVKVGKIVHAQFYLLAQASGTTTNVVNLTGFPYPSADLSPFNQWAGNAWFQSTISVTPLMQRDASAASIYKNTTGTPAVLVASEIHNAYFVGSISYRAA